jgi:hypothetical protein
MVWVMVSRLFVRLPGGVCSYGRTDHADGRHADCRKGRRTLQQEYPCGYLSCLTLVHIDNQNG